MGILGGLMGVVQVYRLGDEQPVRRAAAILVVLAATVVSLVLLQDVGFGIIAAWCAGALIISSVLGDRIRAAIRARRWWIRPLQGIGFGSGPLTWLGALVCGGVMLGSVNPVMLAVGLLLVAVTMGPIFPVLAAYGGVVGLVLGVIQWALNRVHPLYPPEGHQ